jgi:uncharacterized membrane protein YedE/YeeE
MADTRPTKVTFLRAVHLCGLLLFAPRKFLAEEDADNKLRSERTDQQQRERSSLIVRRAFWASLALVIGSGLFGWGLGLALSKMACCAKSAVIVGLQVSGAMILLWGTLFVRGWEIETWSGVTLTERVNQWLYRFLYCAGTAIIVLSLAWTQCP